MESESDLGQIVGDRYLLLDAIGQGGMADVHLARDQRDGRLVALKWLARSKRAETALRERMKLEAELLAQVKHPNVVQLLDYGVTRDGVPYIVLEALRGETLHEYLARRGAMSAEEALPLALELANALDAVHQVGLVHGDVKPHNVFLCGPLDRPEHVKLIDFGFAQVTRQESTNGEATVAGTIEYMAPEQILSEPIDPRADIYSLGVVLFRWLTGELPFDTGAMLRLFAHHLESKAPPPSWLLEDIHPGLETLILACMRKNPDNRYSCMADLITDLLCIILDLGQVSGAALISEPDEYWPHSEQGKRALGILSSLGASTRTTPVPDENEKSIPMSSGVRATESGVPSGTAVDGEIEIVEKATG